MGLQVFSKYYVKHLRALVTVILFTECGKIADCTFLQIGTQ